MNAVEIEEAISLLAEQPFVPAEFPYSFLEAFGNKETTIKRLKTGNNNKSDIEGGVLQQSNIHIAVCNDGNISEKLKQLKDSPATSKNKVKFILATDGNDFQAEDVNSGETVACNYLDFHNHFGFFLPLAGISTVKQIRENAFDIKATSRLNKLYIELLRSNPEWATAERRHDMNHFLARLIFCFFAEDTDIFRNDCRFTQIVQQTSAGDGSNTHEVISEIFRVMDTKQEERADKKVKSWAVKFPYVNGQLFSGSTETPKFTKIARSYLLHVGNLDWKMINPDIFGSMIQAVADEDERGELGMHYTSVPNILKVLNPLFLDELRSQLEEADDNARKLLNLRKRISRIRVFDPACGSGNFLVIAYKQLREIEFEINKRRSESDRPTEIPLTNFRGIELRDFSAEIARLALIIAEYQCDVLYRGQKLALAEFLPLNAENWITSGNALRVNWLSICPPVGKNVKIFGDDLFSTSFDQAEVVFENEGGETYICGNPPYLGATIKIPRGASQATKDRIKKEEESRKSDLKAIFAYRTTTWKSLDYVAGWFMKAADYGMKTKSASAFVSTNSICQGQQVPTLWPLIYNTGHQITFAHTSFKWANLATNNAGVTVVIVGISNQVPKIRRLFTIGEDGETIEKKTDNINTYLSPGKNIELSKSANPLTEVSPMDRGDSAVDGGGLLLDIAESNQLKLESPNAHALFVRPYIGSEELINGKSRFCLWITDNNKSIAEQSHFIKDRLEKVRSMRLESSKKQTVESANDPHKFGEIRHRESLYTIVVPRHSSENRSYLPFGLVEPGSIIADSAFAFYDAPLWNMSLISSRIHLVWIKAVCGQLETRIRYSNTLGWNTFPIPTLTAKNKEDLKICAEEILIARERHFPATIADLYNPEEIPEDLWQAHDRNDEVLERIYIGRRFKNDTERLEKLFELYTQMTAQRKAL
ncbi:DNA methyltransferase [Daejeonella sp.]|uniref:class I SAM-dependent DNA methyltransferase n=1 Tax=Daejeonella sp. TaxID=2805397 RepID=UPI0030C6521F